MRVLIIEPFYGGSHRQLVDFLERTWLQNGWNVKVLTLPAKKWHWRARTSALFFSQKIPSDVTFDVLFCSSVLNLAELLALCPSLGSRSVRKVVYFHENQLIYPVRAVKERDFQYGYNQILAALAADVVVFNSKFNQTSFLDHIQTHLNTQPDHRADWRTIRQQIESQSRVIYFPIDWDALPHHIGAIDLPTGPLKIVWPHRWEHDKNPDSFFKVLARLKAEGHQFVVSILGEAYAQVPEIFATAQIDLGPEFIAHWGFLPSREDYYHVLQHSDIVVSTAHHEFFGVSMLEATYLGCLPLVPNRLVYPELYPKECVYNTDQQLFKKLRAYCITPRLVSDHRHRFRPQAICDQFKDVLDDFYDILKEDGKGLKKLGHQMQT
ncbi:hypothetical protein TCAL_10204 [Tigriopus californicus]|uniref:tRNA-queuosine alpha-mannosyltransferase n=1 Tax=Tigriopus californicus TaxID=6832 RepID=A0A553PH53_TIGCA|nr:glycosyltransferase-like domain-containing protein 1 [Tigriopus californicus]TRY76995.1 hypothetical protein TCAL_10204 [Tigriopus californicus]|eukprot:TCALIF_10204-PA protein Name:"Similar to CG15914 Glycosyltransferase-like domain-containing protein 1-like (Drosophila melanogaster)" AED:0.16 eAED:0.16 QI:0/-1/0/1/-1/1/1/0/379